MSLISRDDHGAAEMAPLAESAAPADRPDHPPAGVQPGGAAQGGDGGRRRRRVGLAVVGVAALGAGVAGAALVLNGSDDADPAADETAPLRAVEATQQDLIEYTELDATMGFADVEAVTAGQEGTVTAVIDGGDVVERGDVVYEIDAQPVVAFYGDIPLYRPLSEGDDGDDVLLLEENLASLGYHTTLDADDEEVDTGFTVDGVFDAATTDAVLRWQEDLERAETGEVAPTDVVVVPGAATASNVVVEPGSRVQPGSPILDLNVTSTVRAFYAEHTGEIEIQVVAGSTVTSGDVVYTVDDTPVVAIVADPADDVTFDRDLVEGVEDGDDIEVVERFLADRGYDADGDLDVDDTFDEATTEALTDWQDDLADTYDEVDVDGRLDLDEIVVVEPGTIVGSITDRRSDTTATGSELFTDTVDDGSRIVTTSIEVADQDRVTEGDTVEVEFPDGTVVAGTVTDLARSSQVDPMNPDADPTLAVEVTLDTVPDSAADFNELDVTVLLVDELETGATVVPVTALVALGDGNYAVEVYDGGPTTRFVAVETGMFADGMVAVTGIDVGTAVVVPS